MTLALTLGQKLVEILAKYALDRCENNRKALADRYAKRQGAFEKIKAAAAKTTLGPDLPAMCKATIAAYDNFLLAFEGQRHYFGRQPAEDIEDNRKARIQGAVSRLRIFVDVGALDGYTQEDVFKDMSEVRGWMDHACYALTQKMESENPAREPN